MRFWKIDGYNGLTKIYERELKTGCFSEKEIQTVLLCDGSRGSVISLCWLAVFGADTRVTVEVEVLS